MADRNPELIENKDVLQGPGLSDKMPYGAPELRQSRPVICGKGGVTIGLRSFHAKIKAYHSSNKANYRRKQHFSYILYFLYWFAVEK